MHRRHSLSWGRVGALAILAVASAAAHAADSDSREARAREMLHRTQEALRQAQADNATLTRAKADAEQKLQDAVNELTKVRNGSKSTQASLRTDLTSVRASNEDLQHKLEDSERRLTAMTAERKDVATHLAQQESELKDAQQSLEQSKAAHASCEAKNLKLYEYSQALLKQYRNKGVWAALSQKDPVLGLGEVRIENVLQEYQDKFQSQRLSDAPTSPAASTAPASPTPPTSPRPQ